MTRGVLRSGLELFKTMVFARILFPYDYGLMAIAMIGIGLLESFTNLGLELKIQSDEEVDSDRLQVYWTLRAVRGALLFALAWVLAAPLTDFYEKPELKSLVRFLALTFLFDGISSFGREICQRRLDLLRMVILDGVFHLFAVTAGIIFLFFYRDYWALAFYSVSVSFCMMIVSFILTPWHGLRFAPYLLKGVASFAGSIFLINFLNYLFNQLDKGIIGKLLTVEDLGLYTRAYFLALLPVVYGFQAVAPVILNVFRRSDDEPNRLRRAFVKTLMAFCLLSFGISVLFFFFGPFIIKLVYGERWLAVLPAFNVLIIYGASKAVVSICPPVFFIRQKPWMATVATAMMVGTFALLCYPLTTAHGLVGAAWAVVISGVGAHALGFILCFHLLRQPGPFPPPGQEVHAEVPKMVCVQK